MSQHGQFVWYELMTRNRDAMVEFYTNVIGWGTMPWSEDEMDYIMFTKDADDPLPVAGAMQMNEPDFPANIPSHFMGYISTNNIAADAVKAEELGATLIHGPAVIPKVGTIAIFHDPQNAVFALYQGEEEQEYKAPTTGEFSWHELATTDYEKAFDFYSAMFDWEVREDMDMGNGMIYRMFGVRGTESTIGGMYNQMPDQKPDNPNWMFYTTVEDINGATGAVKKNGGVVLNGPMEVPDGSLIVQCMDPEGTAFALHQAVHVSV